MRAGRYPGYYLNSFWMKSVGPAATGLIGDRVSSMLKFGRSALRDLEEDRVDGASEGRAC